MIVQIVKFRSGLPDDEVRGTMEERAPAFRALPGLLQKLYAHDPRSGEYAGIYVWDDHESLAAFRASELAQTIPAAYRVEGEPDLTTLDVISLLRPEAGVTAETLAPGATRAE